MGIMEYILSHIYTFLSPKFVFSIIWSWHCCCGLVVEVNLTHILK
jgi:hypothetical protein